MELFDIHTHILPDIDDGAKTPEISRLMLELLKSQGVNNVALTPHYYSHKMSPDNFLSKREKSFEMLKPYVPEGMSLTLASEVYLTKYIFNNRDLSEFCYKNTKFILIEFSEDASFEQIKSLMERFFCNYNYIPIIAHLERYQAFKNINNILELSDMGCLMQTNIQSLTKFPLRHRMSKLIEEGVISFVGTDCHSMGKRNPEFNKHIKFLEKKYSSDIISDLMINASHLFNK